jgi:hypothetical protein
LELIVHEVICFENKEKAAHLHSYVLESSSHELNRSDLVEIIIYTSINKRLRKRRFGDSIHEGLDL